MIDEKKLIENLTSLLTSSEMMGYLTPFDVVQDCIEIVEKQPQADKWIPCKPDKPLEEDENCASKEFLEECKEVAKKYKKPMTNADRIRNMSGEELAELLAYMQETAVENGADTKESIMRVLQAEVEEGAEGE